MTTTPTAGSATGIDLAELPLHHLEGAENGGYYLATDVHRLIALARATPQHSVTEQADDLECCWMALLDAANAYLSLDADPGIMVQLGDKQTWLGLGTKAQLGLMCDGRSGAEIERVRAALAIPASTAPTEFVTRESALEAIQHVAHSNTPGQAIRAAHMLVPASTAASEQQASGSELRAALKNLLQRYVGLVVSGDAGNWDAETEDVVIAARAALSGRATIPSEADERFCPACQGSGEGMTMEGAGPDAYEVPCACPYCKGSGDLLDAYHGLVALLDAERKKYLDAYGKIAFPALTHRATSKREMPPEMKAAIEEAHKTGATAALLPNGAAVFINYGHDYGDNTHLECTACGGSGHIEDQQARAAAPDTATTAEQQTRHVTIDPISFAATPAATTASASIWPNRDEFEKQARYQGATDFTPVHPDFEVCNNGWTPATYRDPMTELAWRVWANKSNRAPSRDESEGAAQVDGLPFNFVVDESLPPGMVRMVSGENSVTMTNVGAAQGDVARDAADSIVRDVCELDYTGEDWAAEKMLSVTMDDLRLIAERNIAAMSAPATSKENR